MDAKYSDYEQNKLNLLKFAFTQEGILAEKYYIGLERNFDNLRMNRGLEDKICLLKREDDMWEVSYIEKGQKSSTSVHTQLFDALNDTWRRLIGGRGPWKHLEAFKREKSKKP